jgi:RNA polymerase sigma-70 factor (ECF subfamily)
VHEDPRRAELELAERHSLGDPSAFEEVYSRHETMVFNLALRLTGNESDAADCSQEVFLRVYRHLGKYRGRAALKTWIYRVVLNCFRSSYARKARRRAVVREVDGECLDRAVDPARGPEEKTVTADMARRVREALPLVRPVYREALVLRDVQDLSYQEIAGVLGVRLGTVRSRIARGRDELRKLMESER